MTLYRCIRALSPCRYVRFHSDFFDNALQEIHPRVNAFCQPEMQERDPVPHVALVIEHVTIVIPS